MINPTLTADMYRFLTDDSVTFADALGLPSEDLLVFDHQAALDGAFEDGSWLETALDAGPTSATASQVVFGTGNNTFTVNLSGVPGNISQSDLQALFQSDTFGTYVSSLTLVRSGTTILSASVGASQTTVTSGDQVATFLGSLTGSAEDAFDVLMRMPGLLNMVFEDLDSEEDGDDAPGGAASGGASGGGENEGEDDHEDHSFGDYLAYLGETGFSSMILTDDGTQVGEVSVSNSELLLSYLGVEFALSGSFANGDTADLFRLLGGALEMDFSALDDMTGVTLTGMTIENTDGDQVFGFSGSYTSAFTFEDGVMTVTGSDGADTDLDDITDAIDMGQIEEGEFAKIKVNLGAGADEFTYSTFRRAFQSEQYGTDYPAMQLHGGADQDTLELDDLEEDGVFYDRELVINWGTGRVDLNASFTEGQSQSAIDIFLKFQSIKTILVATYGDLDVTGDDGGNVLAFEEFGGDIVFDGGAGKDRLDFSDLIGGPDYHDSGASPMFDGDMTFGDFKSAARVVIAGDGEYDFLDKQEGDHFAELTSVEQITFDDGSGGTETFDIGRLVETRLMADLDGTLGGDFLIKEISHVGGHVIGSGADGARGTNLKKSSQVAIALEDFTGDGIADVMFKHATTNEKSIIDGDSGAKIGIGRAGQTFVTALDMDGDGTHEMLYAKSNGDLVLAAVDRNYTYEARYSSPNDTVLGVGDFDGDGDDDIALQLANGAASWIDTDDDQLRSFGQGTAPDVVGIGDTNGDGTDELIFERGNGTLYSADRSGQVVTKFGLTKWDLVGVGDLNGDGADDLLVKKGNTYSGINGMDKTVLTQFMENDTFLGLSNLGFDMVDDMLFSDASLGLQVHEAGNGDLGNFGWQGDAIYLAQATGLAGFDYEMI